MTIAGAQFSTTAGDSDIYVANFDPSGSLLWAHKLGSKRPDRATSIATTSTSDLVLTGYFGDTADFGAGTLVNSASGVGDVLLLKLAGTDGHTVWSKGFGNSSIEEGKDVAVDKNDNIILLGHYFSMPLNLGGSDLPPIGNGKEATFYAKFDKSGAHLWSYQLGAASPGSVKVNHTDEILLTAAFYAPLNLAPRLETLKKLGGSASSGEVIKRMKLSTEEQAEKTTSGQLRIRNQIGWARCYLRRDGLIHGSPPGGSYLAAINYST